MSIPWQIVGAVGTPLTVLVLSYQLWQRKKQFTTEFEDKLTGDYRDIIYELPVDALLDDSNCDGYEGELDDYYRYIDLTNDQIFLRSEGRVSKSTWENWAMGIETNLQRDDFAAAWDEIQARAPESFTELRNFKDPEMSDDPLHWNHPYRATFQALLQRFRI